jgi:hypothetical protein
MTFTANFGIGTLISNVVTLASLGVEDPIAHPDPYFSTALLGSGQLRGVGASHIIWEWGFLGDKYKQGSSNLAREALRDYCAGASASVFIVSLQNEGDTPQAYSAVMFWPFPEERTPADAHRRLNFKLEFRNCVPVTLP